MTASEHRDLADGPWWSLSILEQLGNIGSEVGRAIRWQSRNAEISRGAFYRGLDLFDLTLADPRWRQFPARLREVARAREVVVDFLAGANEYGSTADSLQRYFDACARAARLEHERAGR